MSSFTRELSIQYSKKASNILKKDNLTRLDIPFEEVDIESDEDSMKAAMHGVRSLPTALVEGPGGETIFLS